MHAFEGTENPRNCKMGPEMNGWGSSQKRTLNHNLSKNRPDGIATWENAGHRSTSRALCPPSDADLLHRRVHFGAHLAISGILRALRPRLHEVGRHGDGGRRVPSRDRRTGDAVLGESAPIPLTLSAVLHHMLSEESERAWENRHLGTRCGAAAHARCGIVTQRMRDAASRITFRCRAVRYFRRYRRQE